MDRKTINIKDVGSNPSNTAIKTYSGGDPHFYQIKVNSDDSEEVVALKVKLVELQRQFEAVNSENESNNLELAHAKYKISELEKKFNYLKDNHELIKHLKEAYLNMKANKKDVETQEQGVQTWEGIICEYCVETQSLREELEKQLGSFNDAILLEREDVDSIYETAKMLSNVLQERLCSEYEESVEK